MKPSFMMILAAAAAMLLGLTAYARQAESDERPVRIIFLRDLHVSPETEAAERLREAVAQINRTAADAVIVAGDLTNEGSDDEL